MQGLSKNEKFASTFVVKMLLFHDLLTELPSDLNSYYFKFYFASILKHFFKKNSVILMVFPLTLKQSNEIIFTKVNQTVWFLLTKACSGTVKWLLRTTKLIKWTIRQARSLVGKKIKLTLFTLHHNQAFMLLQ